MIEITLSDRSIEEIVSGSYALILTEDFSSLAGFKSFAKKVCPELAKMLAAQQFTGKTGQLTSVLAMHKSKAIRIICAGVGSLGKKKTYSVESYRRALASIVKKSCCMKCESLAFMMPSGRSFGIDAARIAQETAIIANMANYHFNEYITDDAIKGSTLSKLIVCHESGSDAAVKRGIKEGNVIAVGVNKARH